MTLKFYPIPFIRRNSITELRFIFIYTLQIPFCYLSMFPGGCISYVQNHPLLPGDILRLRAGVGVCHILPTQAPTPTPAKTADSDRLQLRSRLRLRSPVTAYVYDCKCEKTKFYNPRPLGVKMRGRWYGPTSLFFN